jgi:hypothetical protein
MHRSMLRSGTRPFAASYHQRDRERRMDAEETCLITSGERDYPS